MHNAATEIFQTFMDRQSDIILTGDVKAYVATLKLPIRRVTVTHDALIENFEDLRSSFKDFTANLQTLGANDFVRLTVSAKPLGRNYIQGLHVSHIMRNGVPMMQPYEGRSVITLHNGDWRMIEAERNVVSHSWAPNLSHVPAPSGQELSLCGEDIRKSLQDPLKVYQDHLDAIAKAERARDFEAFIRYLRFPHTVHNMEMDTIISTPDDIRPFFSMIQRTYNGEVGDSLVRTAERAEFVGSDLLVGYHTGRTYKEGKPVLAPVSSRMFLQFIDGRWQLLSVANSIKNESYPFDMYAPGESLLSELDIQKRTKEWPSFLRKRTITALPS